MKDCPSCGALITTPGAARCWSCTEEAASAQLALVPRGPVCGRCGRRMLSDAERALLDTRAYEACYRPGTLIPAVIKDSLRELVRDDEYRLGACRGRAA